MEYIMVKRKSKQLQEHFGIETPMRQFSIGLKRKEGTRWTQFFTGGMSAVDIWGQNTDSVTVIELKYGRNIMVGIISELFLYACIFRDIVNGLIKAPVSSCPTDEENKFYKTASNKKCVYAAMLADEYHPLVNDSIISLLNTNKFSTHTPIVFRIDTYKYSVKTEELKLSTSLISFS